MNHTRFEVLLDGTRVFYFNVGNLPPSETSTLAQQYIDKINEHFGDTKTIFVPVRGDPCCPPQDTPLDWNKIVNTIVVGVIMVTVVVISYFGSR